MNQNSNKSILIIKILITAVLIYLVFIAFVYIRDKYYPNKEAKDISKENIIKDNIDSDPLNITYNIDDENITLRNGVSSNNIENSSAKIETRIFGKPVEADINDDGKLDSTFFISQETGGTGIFFYIVGAIRESNGYKGTKAIFLGDRISPQNINIDKGIISANYVIRGDDEPMTVEPSIGITKYLVYKNGELLEIKNN